MSSTDVSQSALRTLLDKQEITELLARYCRAIDRLDEELLRSVYRPDGYDDHMNFAGPVAEGPGGRDGGGVADYGLIPGAITP